MVTVNSDTNMTGTNPAVLNDASPGTYTTGGDQYWWFFNWWYDYCTR